MSPNLHINVLDEETARSKVRTRFNNGYTHFHFIYNEYRCIHDRDVEALILSTLPPIKI